MDDDGLLTPAQPGVQLTWMDAKIGDWVVTPRSGKPVEIQALWYNALRIMEDLAARFGDTLRTRYSSAGRPRRATFNRLFWNDVAGCLYDVVNGGPPRRSIRPNQIFAVSLPSCFRRERARAVVEIVDSELLTPSACARSRRPIRATAPAMKATVSRDRAYHQGTVWPWLLGPFITAYVKVNGGTARARTRAAICCALRGHLGEAGLGQISEIFDGDPPHNPAAASPRPGAWPSSSALCVKASARSVPAEGCSRGPARSATARLDHVQTGWRHFQRKC